MLGSNKSGGETPSNYRRRVFQREMIPFTPNAFNIDLGQANVGRVINLSEGGLAVRTDANAIGGLISQMRFKFSKSEAWIETGGKVIWSDPSSESAGIEFIGLPLEGRDQIRDFLSEVRSPEPSLTLKNALQSIQPTKLADVVPEPLLGRLPDPVPHVPTFVSIRPTEAKALPGALGKPAKTIMVCKEEEKASNFRQHWIIVLCIAILLAAGLAVFLPKLLGRKIRPEVPAAQDIAAAEEVPAPLDKPDPVDPPAEASAPSKPIAPPRPLSGFVLQAGAMAVEANAEILADALRQDNVLVFVNNSSPDHLFRVYVGPFPDRESALKTRTALGSKGIPAILKSWSPPAKP